jgi:hypothetical protein
VVIGILIALQLNTAKENKSKNELGYQYLTEMRTEVQSDLIGLESRIRRLDRNIKNHEAALRTKNIATLPLDSIAMILRPENLDFKISELTFNRMKNLGLTSLTENDTLNSQISTYYNASVVSLKLSMDYVFEELRKYSDFLMYQQDEIDFTFFNQDHEKFEFPALYKQSKEAFNNETKISSAQFITSIRGRMLILDDLNNKRYSLRVLTSFKSSTQNLLETIYAELKSKDPKIEPLPEFPSDADFKEIVVAPAILKQYVGTYTSKANFVFQVLLEDARLYIELNNGDRQAIIPSAEDRFFINDYFVVIQFNRKKDDIISFSINFSGERTDYIKVE